LGIGIFRADATGRISRVVGPGDAAPGGGTFDYAVEPWVNDGGDVSFIGHIVGKESAVAGFPPQAEFISALGGLSRRAGREKFAPSCMRVIVRLAAASFAKCSMTS
jgi:hypothetical protein